MSLFIVFSLLVVCSRADSPDYATLLREVHAHGLKHYCGVAPGVQFDRTGATERGGAAAAAAGQLAQVVMVMRHGDRSSWGWYQDPAAPRGRLSCWPGDAASWQCDDATHNEFVGMASTRFVAAPWLYRRVYIDGRNVQAGTCAQGVLSHRGILQQITNGHNIRAAYVDGAGLMPDNWETAPADAIYLRTTNVPRTIQSAQSMFYGIYGNATKSGSTNRVPVIDMHTMDETMDNMTPNPNICPGLVRLSTASSASAGFKAFESQILNPLIADVALAIGYPNLTADNMADLLDCARAHLCHGKPLHPALTTPLLERMAAAVAFTYQYSFTYPTWRDGARVTIGTLLQDVEDAMRTNRSFSLFSGHDTTILPLLMALNVTNVLWPPYAATLIFEVYRDGGATPTAVTLKYLGQPLPIPGCAMGSTCTWAEFTSYVASVQPSGNDCA